MARNEKMTKLDEEMVNSTSGGGSTTHFTDNNEYDSRGRGVFGRAIDFIFSEKKNESYAEEIQLSTKDLMWAVATPYLNKEIQTFLQQVDFPAL